MKTFIKKPKLIIKVLLMMATTGGLVSAVLVTDRKLPIIYDPKPYLISSYFETLLQSPHQKIAVTGEADPDSGNVLSAETAAKYNSIPVLLYHGIVKNPDGFNVTYDNFFDQMKVLKNNGYQTLTLKELQKFLKGELDLSHKSIVITFDDGRRDSYYPAERILKEQDYTAAIFIITSETDHDNFYLSSPELKSMVKSGRWEIGSHTANLHEMRRTNRSGEMGPALTNPIWLDSAQRAETEDEMLVRVKEDLEESKNYIAGMFDQDIIAFSFPYGDYGQSQEAERSTKILSAAYELFDLSFYQPWSRQEYSFNRPLTNARMVKRLSVDPSWSGEELLESLAFQEEKPLPYESNFSKNPGWVLDWGLLSFEENTMCLRAAPTATTAATFLQGSHSWDNYRYEATIDDFNGAKFLLLTGYREGREYLSCEFSNVSVEIMEKHDEDKNILARVKTDNLLAENREPLKVGIERLSERVRCTVNGQVILEQELDHDPHLYAGDVGIKVWGPRQNEAYVRISQISVSALDAE